MSQQIDEMAQEAARQISEDFDRIHRDAQAHSHPDNYKSYLVARLWPVIAQAFKPTEEQADESIKPGSAGA